MKNFLYTLVLFTMTLGHVYSQKTLSTDYPYKVSEPYKVFDAKEKLYFSKGNETIAVKFDKANIMIQKFDSEKPSFISEKRYVDFFPKNYSFERVLETDNSFYFFYSSWDGDNNKEQLFSIEIDFVKGEFIGNPRLLLQVKDKLIGKQVVFGFKDKFDFFQSYDKKIVLIKYIKKPLGKDNQEDFNVIGLFNFDEKLNKVSGNEFTMPYNKGRMDIMNYQVDNNGSIYMVSKVFNTNQLNNGFVLIARYDTQLNYKVELLLIKAGSNKIEITKLINDKFINNLSIIDTDKGYVVCGGHYSDNMNLYPNSIHSDGIITFKIKYDGTIYDKNTYEIPLVIINQNESKSLQKDNEKSDNPQMTNIKKNNVFVNKDGSYLIIGEQYFKYMSSDNTPTPSFYNAILVSKINADGKLAWMKKISKEQKGFNGKGGLSYKYFNFNNNHQFVFLDHIKNIDLSLENQPSTYKDENEGSLVLVELSDNYGVVSKKTILNTDNVNGGEIYQFSTDRIIKTSENSFLIEVYKKKKEDIMIKVNLN